MFAHPGKKLLFMGDEFGQIGEWHHDRSLDWHLLDDPAHRGVQRLVRDLNRLYSSMPSLHEIDYRPSGFRWINSEDRENSVLSLIRFDGRGTALISISNLTPIVRDNFRLGVPESGTYAEILNSDAEVYGGSGVGNLGSVDAVDSPRDWLPATISLRLPPLATVYLTAVSRPVGLEVN
jgi:1,4-alpha-glucan branching enzyme